MIIKDMNQQRIEWKRKGWSIPDLRGGKQDWYTIVFEMVQQIGANPITDLSLLPELHVDGVRYPWRMYIPFLQGVGLVNNHSGVLTLSDTGYDFFREPSKRKLSALLHDRYRLFGELLVILIDAPKTIEDVDRKLCHDFSLDWRNLSNTRRRMDWLEVRKSFPCRAFPVY